MDRTWKKSYSQAWMTLIVMTVFVLLYLPVVVMVFASVNQASHGAEWKGWTWKWYQALFENRQALEALKTSLSVAGLSASISCPVGLLLGLGLAKLKPGRGFFLNQMVYLPMIVPDMVMGVSLLASFSLLSQWLGQLQLGLMTMITAHATFQIPFVALLIQGRMRTLDPALFEAARDLGADAWQRFWRVTFPLLFPALVASALLAFTLSIDDFIISFFTSGAGTTSLPVYIYSSVKRGLSPEIHALSSLLVLTSTVTTFLVLFLQRKGSKSVLH